MGCCGCDNRSSANTAAIFAIVQCIVGIILAIYNLPIFSGTCWDKSEEKAYLCATLFESSGSIKALLIVVMILYLIWGISSLLLLVGNSKNRAGYVRQWVIVSTIVIICDIVLPAVLMGLTYAKIINQYQQIFNNRFDGITRTNLYTDASHLNLVWNYMVLCFTFTRGGLITWICDIALTVYTSRRAREIENPPATYVFTQVVPGTVPIQQGFVPQAQPMYYPYQPSAQYPQGPGQFQYAPPVNRADYTAAPPPAYSSNDKGHM